MGAVSVKGQKWPVFFDPKGRRGAIVTTITWGAWAVIVGLAASLLATSIWGPNLPSTKLTMQPRLISALQGLPPASMLAPLLLASHARTASRVAADAA